VRIALNLGTLRGQGSGSVGRSVLRELVSGSEHEFLAWAPQQWRGDPAIAALAREPRVALRWSRPGFGSKLLRENVAMRRALRAWRAQRLFSLTDTSLIACPVPHLLLVHQPFLAYAPHERGFRAPPRLALRMWAMAHYFRAGLRGVTRLTVQTHDMRRRLAARFAIAPERIAVIPSAIERGRFARTQPRREQPLYVCYVASALPHKNHVVLAAMMAELAPRWPDLRCRLTVALEQVPELAAAARARGVLDRFEFLGALAHERVPALLADALALVMPSRLESFGLPYYEAMAIGCPVVAADLPFAREACADAGLYADPGSGAAFAAQVARLLETRAAREDAGERALVRFSAIERSWADVARDYLALLEEP
jgi:glycosyltransferase involved in cell wall biosynthesis